MALSDPHFCILSRDCILSREYFSLWAIKTSLDRNASAVFDPEMLFSRVARHLACLALRVSQGFWGTREHWQNIEGNKGTLANFWEQGNKIRKITIRKNSDI